MRERTAFVTIGFCLKALGMLGVLGVGAYYYGAREARRLFHAPNLKLSAVFHGDQAKWCFDYWQKTQEPPKKELQQEFKIFVQEQLPAFITQVTFLKQPTQQLVVTWQATPHNQCQFIFKNNLGRVEVERRVFSASPTIEKHGEHYRVKETLHVSDVSVASKATQSLGVLELEGIEFDQWVSTFVTVEEHLKSAVLPEEKSVIETVYGSEASSAGESSPVEGERKESMADLVQSWMYND